MMTASMHTKSQIFLFRGKVLSEARQTMNYQIPHIGRLCPVRPGW